MFALLGIISNKMSWLFQSSSLPSNTHTTNDGHLLIHDFHIANLGTYTCSIETPTKQLSDSIELHPNDIITNTKPLFTYQIYSSRADYRFGGHLLVECISSGKVILQIFDYKYMIFLKFLRAQCFKTMDEKSKKNG